MKSPYQLSHSPQPQLPAVLDGFAKQILVRAMKDNQMTYADLSKKLEELGIFETPDQLNRKVNRQRFKASFWLACLIALGVTGVRFHPEQAKMGLDQSQAPR